MKRPFALLGPVAAAMLATAACASSSPYAAAPSAHASPAPTASPVAVSPAQTGTLIQVGASRLGQILVDSNGRTVYLFVADSGACELQQRRMRAVLAARSDSWSSDSGSRRERRSSGHD